MVPNSQVLGVPVGTVAVGKAPAGIAADRKTGIVYVANSGQFTAAPAGSASVPVPCRAAG